MAATTKIFEDLDRKYEDQFVTMTENEKMITGLRYLANEPFLIRARLRARRLAHAYNQTKPSEFDPPDLQEPVLSPSTSSVPGAGADLMMGSERKQILSQLFQVPIPSLDKVEVEPPFWCDYGSNIKLEGAFYCNFNTTILDCAEIRIGDGVLFGPNVHIYSATHSVSITEREQGYERALPVAIGKDTWVGGNVTIMGGVTIGRGCTIGAGSVVTRDIPDWSVAVGSPAKVVRTLSEEERGK